MNKRQCVSCGAPIEIGAHKCSYCGMTYDPAYWEGYIQYIPIRTERMKLRAKVELPADMTLRYGEEAMARMAKRDITKQIAEGLSEVLKYRMSNDPFRDTVIVSGEVWVEKPSAYY